MEILGELKKNYIFVKKSNDIGRLYNKSNMGTIISGNVLQLNLLEGVFLLDERKIRIYHNKKPMNFSQLLKLAAQQIPEFEIKYIVFKDLRNRGYAITLTNIEEPVTFIRYNKDKTQIPSCNIVAFSERDILNIDAVKHLTQQITNQHSILWFALVDEEGDLTYYTVSEINLAGDNIEQHFQKGTCIILKNRLVLFDIKLGNQLHEKEFFGKPFGEVLQLSFVEALYLLERNIINIQTIDGKSLSENKCLALMQKQQPDIKQRLIVFKDLKKRGLLVKTGFKFGTHFRAYTRQPDKTHAEYLIHIVEKGYCSIWAEISRAVRLAHSVNKEFIFAHIDNNTIDYIKLGRLRP